MKEQGLGQTLLRLVDDGVGRDAAENAASGQVRAGGRDASTSTQAERDGSGQRASSNLGRVIDTGTL